MARDGRPQGNKSRKAVDEAALVHIEFIERLAADAAAVVRRENKTKRQGNLEL